MHSWCHLEFLNKHLTLFYSCQKQCLRKEIWPMWHGNVCWSGNYYMPLLTSRQQCQSSEVSLYLLPNFKAIPLKPLLKNCIYLCYRGYCSWWLRFSASEVTTLWRYTNLLIIIIIIISSGEGLRLESGKWGGRGSYKRVNSSVPQKIG